MRALKVLTVVMGLLIVAGVAVVVTTIVRRGSAPGPGPVAWQARLDEPAGSAVAGIAAAGPALALLLQGGGADRVVLIDPRTGGVAGRVTLGSLPGPR